MISGKLPSRSVFINGVELSPSRSQKLKNHSPDGFNWGYGGSGPAQLALALMLEFTNNDREALWCYQDFKWDIIAKLSKDDFELDQNIVDRWLVEKFKNYSYR